MLLGLIKRPESESLDFKRDFWKLEDEEGITDFVKDVICMANTVRDDDAYIVVGIDCTNGQRELYGIKAQIDDARLQELLDSRVHPVPIFTYEEVEHLGKRFGVVTVPPAQFGPCMPLKDLPHPKRQVLRHGSVYIRRGSRNSVAGPNDLTRFVEWLRHHNATGTANGAASSSPAWNDFVEAVHGFDAARRYLLVSTPISTATHHDLPALASLPWVACVDLDPLSEVDGLLRAVGPSMREHRSVYPLTPVDPLQPGGSNATYWVFARGLAGRPEVPESASYRAWVTTYQADITSKIAQIAAANLPSPATALVLAYDPAMTGYVRAVVEATFNAYGAVVDVVVATDDTAAYSSLAREYDLPLVEIPLGQLCSGLASLHFNAGAGFERALPSSSGAPASLNPADVQWIEEELELLYLAAGSTPRDGNPVGQNFLRGDEADWYDLALHADVDRDKYDAIRQMMETQLVTRAKTTRVNLYHLPGAGGTTLSRRILWDLHKIYPSALLLRSNPPETAERLLRVHSVTDRPILLVADSGRIPQRTLDDLFESLRARQVPVVILQVMRRNSVQRESPGAKQLDMELTPQEAGRFVEVYARDQPRVRPVLEKIAGSAENRTAFHFGLATFGKEYKGLSSYVAARMEGLDQAQRSIMIHLALAYSYAQQPLPAQAFAQLLDVAPNSPVDLTEVLPEVTRDLLVESQPGWWRTAHVLFASELIEQHMAKAAQPWRNALSEAAIALAECCRGSSRIASSDLLDVARRIFVYRDNNEVLGTEGAGVRKFSQLIEDLPSANAAVHVLTRLTELYPSETHFAAHLARLYAFKMRDFGKAAEWINQAIDESGRNDHVLFHMRGMILRERVSDLIRQRQPLEALIEDVDAASASFEKARSLRADNEHAYISEVQMLIRLLDYSRTQGQPQAGIAYATGGENAVLRAREHAEDLLSQVRRMREDREASPYEAKCRADLDSLYGDHDRAVQAYLGLLDRSDVQKPPLRRSLVWEYLHHRGRQWTSLRRKEIIRIVDLLERNIDEEPENDSNLRLWIQAIRQLPTPPDLDSVIERVSYWKDSSGSLEALYYLSVVSAIRAMEGSRLAFESFERYRSECARRAWTRRDRTRSIEWLGREDGIKSLIHQSELGSWDKGSEFYTNTAALARENAMVSGYVGPQAGKLVLSKSGLEAFYVPSRLGHSRRSINDRVTCHVGFSYDGLRAWNVESV